VALQTETSFIDCGSELTNSLYSVVSEVNISNQSTILDLRRKNESLEKEVLELKSEIEGIIGINNNLETWLKEHTSRVKEFKGNKAAYFVSSKALLSTSRTLNNEAISFSYRLLSYGKEFEKNDSKAAFELLSDIGTLPISQFESHARILDEYLFKIESVLDDGFSINPVEAKEDQMNNHLLDKLRKEQKEKAKIANKMASLEEEIASLRTNSAILCKFKDRNTRLIEAEKRIVK